MGTNIAQFSQPTNKVTINWMQNSTATYQCYVPIIIMLLMYYY